MDREIQNKKEKKMKRKKTILRLQRVSCIMFCASLHIYIYIVEKGQKKEERNKHSVSIGEPMKINFSVCDDVAHTTLK